MAGALGLGVLFLLSNLALQYGAARLAANVTAVVMLTEVLFASVSAIALGAGTLTAALAARRRADRRRRRCSPALAHGAERAAALRR